VEPAHLFPAGSGNWRKNDQNRTSGADLVAFDAPRLLFALSSLPDTA
jgi:hypothetical protein